MTTDPRGFIVLTQEERDLLRRVRLWLVEVGMTPPSTEASTPASTVDRPGGVVTVSARKTRT